MGPPGDHNIEAITRHFIRNQEFYNQFSGTHKEVVDLAVEEIKLFCSENIIKFLGGDIDLNEFKNLCQDAQWNQNEDSRSDSNSSTVPSLASLLQNMYNTKRATSLIYGADLETLKTLREDDSWQTTVVSLSSIGALIVNRQGLESLLAAVRLERPELSSHSTAGATL